MKTSRLFVILAVAAVLILAFSSCTFLMGKEALRGTEWVKTPNAHRIKSNCV